MMEAAVRWVLERLAEACTPRPRLSIAEWAEANLVISEDSNSPRPGQLSLAGVEYILAPLARLDPADQCRQVNTLASAQSAKSLIGQIWIAYSAAENPGPIGIYLPSIDDARKFSEEKMQTLIDASPALRHRFRKVSSRANDGSSTLRKRFIGGSLRIATASSPNALQLVSFRDLVLEEIAGYEPDVGGRGSPIAQAKKRQGAWETRGAKTMQASAAGVQGACPSTAAHESGTAHEIYLPCPHCGGFNRWEWEDLNGPSETLEIGVHFGCRLCGGLVEHKHKAAMVAGHCYAPTYEDKDDPANAAPPRAFPAEERARWEGRSEKGRQPSYRWWLYVSPFTTWDLIWAEGADAKKAGLAAEKTFLQQTLARAWDEGRDAPDHVVLHGLREEYPEGEVPAGAYLLTGMVDVQGDRLHWAVYAWGPGAEWWLIARDVIAGDPSGADVWAALLPIVRREYRHAEGGAIATTFFGIDAGYKSHHVYKFCGDHKELGARALDGRPGWGTPYVGKPKPQKVVIDGKRIGKTLLYPTGTWPLKAELQYSLRKTIEMGPGVRAAGRGHYPMSVDENYLRELTAEVLSEEISRGKIARAWKLRAGFRNEETDLWVGARALAFAAGVGATGEKAFDWDAAREKICGTVQSDLFADRRIPAPAGHQEGSTERRSAPAAEQSAPPPRPASGWTPKHKFTRSA